MDEKIILYKSIQMTRVTFEDVVNEKKLSADERMTELVKLKKAVVSQNLRGFVGNKYLYHYQIANMCKTKVKGKSFYDKINNETEYDKLLKNAEKLNRTGTLPIRLYEADRMNGAVVLFKPVVAKYMYAKYGAKKVLDVTAGWGGRMLGAWALDIEYTGIDTNLSLKSAYDEMITELGATNLRMIWGSCLDVDFSKIEYDFVLTSPPYENVEKYEHSRTWKNDDEFYLDFLIPLINKCRMFIADGGLVCFNISDKMYTKLTQKYNYDPCDIVETLLKQTRLSKVRNEDIYCWRKITKTH